MVKIIFQNYSNIFPFNVSRETCNDIENYIDLILTQNKVINLISRENKDRDYIIKRHILDSMQIIDLIDFNEKKIFDFGSGAGFPGILLAIFAKNQNKKIDITLFEKSFHKSNFLKDVSRKLNLKTEIFQKNIFEMKNMETGTIMSRAFKPLPVVLDLVYENFSKYKNLICFMGKNGRGLFENEKKKWDLEYEEKKSLTSEDSFIINIKKIGKKKTN